MDRDGLPPDAEFKGYEEVVVQDVVVRTDNILFVKEKIYSSAQRKTYSLATSESSDRVSARWRSSLPSPVR